MPPPANSDEDTSAIVPVRWQTATVSDIRTETPRAKSFTFTLPKWQPHRPGQHYDVRLTAPDGYQAQRSYSVASAPADVGSIQLTVELIEDGEVSPYFHEVARPGDEIEVRGPIGGPFTWTTDMGGPLLLVGGGSGVVPLMSILRHGTAGGAMDIRTLLLYSSRTIDDVIYRDELDELDGSDEKVTVLHTLTRLQPPGWTGYSRRVDGSMLADAIESLGGGMLAYVCGPTAFVETVADLLTEAGLTAQAIRTDRFGPTGS